MPRKRITTKPTHEPETIAPAIDQVIETARQAKPDVFDEALMAPNQHAAASAAEAVQQDDPFGQPSPTSTAEIPASSFAEREQERRPHGEPKSDTHGPIVPKFRQFMNELAKVVDDLLNPDQKNPETGFVMLIFPFGGEPGARVNYISNARREDMIVAMKEWLARVEGRAIDTDTKQ